MYFIFSKILLFLLFPIIWIGALMLIALVAKKPRLKKRCLIAAFALLVIFSNHFLLSLFAEAYDVAPVHPDQKKVYSAAIVLGGFSGEDKSGNGFFNQHADRFIQGVKLKTTGQVSHLLISGGNGTLRPGQFTEAGWVKGELKALNIPDSVILIEQRSKNTIENAAYSRVLLQKTHLPPPYLLVTSSWHMRRAAYIFKKEGIDVIPYPCDNLAGNVRLNLVDYASFDAETLYNWNYYLKEVVGLAVTYLKYAI